MNINPNKVDESMSITAGIEDTIIKDPAQNISHLPTPGNAGGCVNCSTKGVIPTYSTDVITKPKNVAIILAGLSCTLKSSIAEDLEKYHGFIPFPDINREYVQCFKDTVECPELLDTTQKIPNIFLVANRLNIYRTIFNCYKNNGNTNIFVVGRTIYEHLFFENQDIITVVSKEKLIDTEREFWSKFDKVFLVLIENTSEEMLRKHYLGEEIRVGITKRSDKLQAYEDMRGPYRRFIEQLIPLSLVLNITDENSGDLESLRLEFANEIANFVNKSI